MQGNNFPALGQILAMGSTRQRAMMIKPYKGLTWRLEAKAFSGPLLNLLNDLSHVFITQTINAF